MDCVYDDMITTTISFTFYQRFISFSLTALRRLFAYTTIRLFSYHNHVGCEYFLFHFCLAWCISYISTHIFFFFASGCLDTQESPPSSTLMSYFIRSVYFYSAGTIELPHAFLFFDLDFKVGTLLATFWDTFS
jgi:hypothetical protein